MTLPQRARARKFSRMELGVTGTPAYAGLIQTDYNPDLQFPKSVAVYDKMRRSDGRVLPVSVREMS